MKAGLQSCLTRVSSSSALPKGVGRRWPVGHSWHVLQLQTARPREVSHLQWRRQPPHRISNLLSPPFTLLPVMTVTTPFAAGTMGRIPRSGRGTGSSAPASAAATRALCSAAQRSARCMCGTGAQASCWRSCRATPAPSTRWRGTRSSTACLRRRQMTAASMCGVRSEELADRCAGGHGAVALCARVAIWTMYVYITAFCCSQRVCLRCV